MRLDLSLEVRYVSEEEAKRVVEAIAEAVVSVVGRVPNYSHTVTPDYDGPGRSEEEERQAALEGRR